VCHGEMSPSVDTGTVVVVMPHTLAGWRLECMPPWLGQTLRSVHLSVFVTSHITMLLAISK